MRHLTSLLLVSLALVFSTASIAQEKDESEPDFYTIVQTMPEFGDNSNEALQSYFVNNSRIECTKTRNNNLHAIFISVIIEKDGKPTFQGIARGDGKKYIKEAKRLIKKMPKWSIGRLNDGSSVHSIIFHTNDSTHTSDCIQG